MRILFASHHSSRVAGTETYVATATAALAARGHAVGLLAEHAPDPAREPISGTSARWFADTRGEAAALDEVCQWQPDVVYVQGLRSLDLERALMAIVPPVLFAHGYAGLCISGSRTWQVTDTPCTRSLGPGCLLKYFPSRCGGRSPVTMWHDYARQRQRQELHAAYRAIVVASWHMAAILAPAGMTRRVHVLPIPVPKPVVASARERGTPIRMVYAGRLERLKGVQLLVAAAKSACARLGVPGELHIVGDGPLRTDLEREARQDGGGLLQTRLDGWRDGKQRDALLSVADVMLVPSLWPEPFGLTGLEAARFGVPTVGFASGGIPEWLRDGINGTLAAEPSARGLADAIVRCVGDQRTYGVLSGGAIAAAEAISPETHAVALERVFAEALR